MEADLPLSDRRALCTAVLAVSAGMPLYLLLDANSLVPISVSDRPWPFELLALAACLATAHAAYVRRSALAKGCLMVALVATIAFSVHSRVIARMLPPPDPTLPVGSALPSLSLQDHRGERVPLRSRRPSLLVFFRASNCPYCRSQLSGIAKAAPRYLDAGVRVVALSPDSSASLARLQAELQSPLELLSDENEAAVSVLCGGKSHCQILADGNGTVRWAMVSESYSDVPAPAKLLQAAYRLDERAP